MHSHTTTQSHYIHTMYKSKYKYKYMMSWREISHSHIT